ncbi:MAG: YraN family protein [Anaerolineaceae bacterium]
MPKLENHRQALGRWGEDAALAHLESRGYCLVQRNYRTPYGEIDLVMRDGDALVFVEVKTRTSTHYGQPEDAVTLLKQSHLQQAAQQFMQEHPEYEDEWRVDVVSILKGVSDDRVEITVFEDAIHG